MVRKKELELILTLLQAGVCPPVAKSTLGPASSLTANVILRGGNQAGGGDAVGRQGSVSVAERSHSATISTPRVVRDSVFAAVFLSSSPTLLLSFLLAKPYSLPALKIMMTCFERELKCEWPRIARMIKDLAMKRSGSSASCPANYFVRNVHIIEGGQALWSFLDFVVTAETPLRILLSPVISQRMLYQKTTGGGGGGGGDALEARLQEEMREKVMGEWWTPHCVSSSVAELSQELKLLREELASRPIDQQSRTPTLLETHSDSGSLHSAGRRTSESHQARRDSRRLSLTVTGVPAQATAAQRQAHSRLSPAGFPRLAGHGLSPQDSVQSPGFTEDAIVEVGPHCGPALP